MSFCSVIIHVDH